MWKKHLFCLVIGVLLIPGMARAQIDLDLAVRTVNGTALGADVFDGFGYATAIGDVNGDGVGDLIAGSRFGAGPGNARPVCGEVSVIFGVAGESPESVDLAAVLPDLLIYGDDDNDLLGSELACGDLNGDGLMDIIIGVPEGQGPANGGISVGELIVVFGSSSFPANHVIDLDTDSPEIAIFGVANHDRLGQQITTGDVNGDGIDDLLFGIATCDPNTEDDRETNGEAYVLFGRSDFATPLTFDLSQESLDIKVLGVDFCDLMAAVGSGDVNGDGIDDILLGARDGSGPDNHRFASGEAYVLFGSDAFTTPSEIDLSVTDPDVVIYTTDNADSFGQHIESGDVNGDGIDDLVVGAIRGDGATNSGDRNGEIHIVFGSDLWTTGTVVDLDSTPADISIFGADSLDLFPRSIAIGDVNRDGIDDLVAGTDQGDGPDETRTDAGEAYILLGRDDFVTPFVLDLAVDSPDFTIFSPQVEDLFGGSCATGDLNGDGINDVAVGAWLGDGPDGEDRKDSGEIQILRGGFALVTHLSLSDTTFVTKSKMTFDVTYVNDTYTTLGDDETIEGRLRVLLYNGKLGRLLTGVLPALPELDPGETFNTDTVELLIPKTAMPIIQAVLNSPLRLSSLALLDGTATTEGLDFAPFKITQRQSELPGVDDYFVDQNDENIDSDFGDGNLGAGGGNEGFFSPHTPNLGGDMVATALTVPDNVKTDGTLFRVEFSAADFGTTVSLGINDPGIALYRDDGTGRPDLLSTPLAEDLALVPPVFSTTGADHLNILEITPSAGVSDAETVWLIYQFGQDRKDKLGVDNPTGTPNGSANVDYQRTFWSGDSGATWHPWPGNWIVRLSVNDNQDANPE